MDHGLTLDLSGAEDPDGQAVGPDPGGQDENAALPSLVEAMLCLTLTPREHDAFEAILRGLSVAQAAAALGVSANTLKVHRKRLFAKLDITSERVIVRP